MQSKPTIDPNRKPILLSVPHMGGREEEFVREAFATNWLSTVGPNITAFEEVFGRLHNAHTLALSSGTAAMHLGLRALEVGPDDEVFCPTLTFVATANPIVYLGARPVFLDCERSSWNLDPEILATALKERAEQNRLPRAVIVVHLFGQSADMDPIMELCGQYGIPVLEDAAEALGATYKGRRVGTIGQLAAFSFNGNKVITTTGGGMLVSADLELIERTRFWSTQARDPDIAYVHSEMGYNYRMSNVLAGIGRGQLLVLDERVARRREIAFNYRDAFASIPGIELMPQASYGLHANWLSCFLIDEASFGIDRDGLIRTLAEANIEARPVWKPMHLQKLYAAAECFGGQVAEDLFRRGICLPSSSRMSDDEQALVIDVVKSSSRAAQ